MKRLLSLLFLLLPFVGCFISGGTWGGSASAQTLISGTVTDASTGETLPYVNIRVNRAGSKTTLRTVATDNDGRFRIEGLANGAYNVTLSFVGYQTQQKAVSLSKATPKADLGTLPMELASTTLGEANVTGTRSAVKLEVDRKSYDVSQDLANIGANASEALENIPSVEVDQDGNISLRGSASVEVWINGKPSGLTSDNRAMILQQLPAESIQRIEVIDNPSAKYSAEGSAGIINIVLKHDRKAGYYGSLQAGANTEGGANGSGSISYNSKWVDVNATVGYRHREDESGAEIDQIYYDAQHNPASFQTSRSITENHGNNVFTRAGVTLHATKKDDISLNGNMMLGRGTSSSDTPYEYFDYATDGSKIPTRTLFRHTSGRMPMRMLNGELDYRHSFTEKHYLNFNLSHGSWRSDMENTYQDRTTLFVLNGDQYDKVAGAESYQFRPQNIRNHWTSLKVDYENPINEHIQLQAGYNADFRRENTPQDTWSATNYEGTGKVQDEAYFNRFIYNSDVHALYATATMKYGKFGVMAGLRYEYWRTHSESIGFDQEFNGADKDDPIVRHFAKPYHSLYPSLFLSYQITENDQLQLNYTRRLRRPWGGQLNPFMDTRSATNVSFGNALLTPEFSNAFALNYLKTMGAHSLLVSAYYRPTTDVLQRFSYRLSGDDRLFSTHENISRSTNAGGEFTLKNRFAQWFDLNTTASFYYYHLNGFEGTIQDPLYHQTVDINVKGDNRFTWSARMQANVRLPYDWSLQATGNYRSREAVIQGWREPSYGLDMGIRKSFLQKKLTLAVNCRDVLDSRKRNSYSETPDFWQHSKFWRHSRKFNFTLTWNFGNTSMKKRPQRPDMNNAGPSDDSFGNEGYGGDME